ncbi:hypothetical protein [Pseudomonas sp. MWU13-2105]|uniref:hypothetical protein n=1 Tax=Pseudomonas sp. MWU13-2105 TaxID=2935074 RepID=UPI0020101843|nr:hypothetical protein [Pseudomonas sp. MWU13-2105]
MTVYADRKQESNKQLVAPQTAERAKSAYQLVDNRPAAIAQKTLWQGVADNSQRVEQLVSRELADNRSPARPTSQLSIPANQAPIQRAVSRSGTYTAAAALRTAAQTQQINAAWSALDGLVPQAVQDATTGVQAAPANRTHSQNAYAANQTPALWGMCVEEQLNNLVGATWDQQVNLGGARPDYGQVFGGIQTYADLTTAAQAGPVGNHITGKLTAINLNPGLAVAADITYGGAQGQVAQLPQWREDTFGARQRHRASSAGNGDAEYNPWANDNPVPSMEQVWQWTQAECATYVASVNREIPIEQFNSESESDMDIESDADSGNEEA